MRKHGLHSLLDYSALVASDRGLEERKEMLYALTTNVTGFNRERQHFHFLSKALLPDLKEFCRAGGVGRLWSAGCSTGQEAYSIAMTVLDEFPEAHMHDLRILATDMDIHSLGVAIAGRYSSEAAASLPASWRNDYFRDDSHDGSGAEAWSVCNDVRRLVTFRELNLLHSWPMRQKYDAIFCRNVVIYFDEPTQINLWRRFADLLRSDGYLFVGHSERVHGSCAPLYRSVGPTIYQRTDQTTSSISRRQHHGTS